MPLLEFDHVVVGGGASGCAVARQLGVSPAQVSQKGGERWNASLRASKVATR